MAIKADNKKQLKASKKQSKKKEKDSFTKKEVYNLTVPSSMFMTTTVGTTILTKQSTAAITERKLRGRVFEVNQGELQGNSPFRKYKFVCTKLTGRDLKSVFNGMELTTDKQKGLVRKWHTLIEAVSDVTTSDDVKLRVFTVAVTKKPALWTKKHCYAKSSQVKEIRKAMFDVVKEEMEGQSVVEIVRKISEDKIDKRIEEMGSLIFPLQNCYVSKVKVLKRPKDEE
ncbi:40S ribosomal protein S3A [Trachipleistophora hominis]|uniref:40S ribosomal protein S3A n=1 Tax=Trachipleistophora hominis TaxID=72359 RepID=L7JZZ6_TRAHO|nr:40S ribosomal protein S3A [Trachipleistophora hominis]